MEIILIQDVNKLGQKDDLVNVKAGYGRNFLIPRGYALLQHHLQKRCILKTSGRGLIKKRR
jgi:large subunit ribosomal protein L9